jgi:hypothetical protein
LKNFTFLLLAVFSILVFNVIAKAQSEPVHRTCATDEVMQQLFQNDPSARARYENTQRQFESRIRAILDNPQHRTQAITTIPVVVHVGVNSARQSLVTNAIIQSQIDTLNFYYGTQPIGDSLRVYTPFRTTYGRSEIRFCMAQRTPANAPSTGIVRTVTSTVFSSANHPSVELGAWDPTKYLNIWVVELSGGVLGFSYLPGSFTPSDPRNGFVNDFRAFGAGPGTSSGGYHFNLYNLGKTAVHEIGHYFNLLHPWGPLATTNPGCANDDFCGDTPLTSAPTFGCPASPVTNTCSPAAPGIQFQNHMDYADDACMYLFTVNQCSRMTTSLTLADRVGLTTSNGCQPIVTTNDDAQVSAILTPTNGTSIACASVPLMVTLRNNGTNNLTSANIRVRVNGVDVPAAAFNFAGNLAPFASTTVTMPNLNLAAVGAYTIKVHSTIPNGVPDSSPANDTSTVSITRVGTATLPVVENFEGASFPSTGWTANNPDGPPSIPAQTGFGWARRASVPSPNGTRAAEIDFYDYSTLDAKDSIVSPDIDMTNPPGLKLLQFDRAHATYGYPPIFAANVDTMEVLVSTNCGASYTSVWKKYGAVVTNPNSLNTVTLNTTGGYTPASAADWLTETIDITSVVGAAPVARVLFKTINRYGNFLFLDNINVSSQFKRDLGVTVITNPLANECNNTITPVVTVRNFGTEVVNSYTVEYTVDGANIVSVTFNTPIAAGATASVTLPVSGVIAAGSHTFRAYTINPVGPSGTGDQNTINDALTKSFTVRNVTNAPAIETFEGAAFPSPNWTISNPNNNSTWVKKNQGYLSSNSAFIDNYNVNAPNQVDEIQTPVFRTTGNGGAQADSVIITWDLAARYYPATPYDTFTVRTSPDCGNTFPNTLFNAGGPTLGAADGNDFLVPIESEWRSRRVSVGGAAITSGTHMVGFRNKNQFGNNMFVDNINVSLLFKRDVGVVAINNPDAECSAAFTPNVTVRNFGSETVTAFSVSYRINNGAIQTASFTGQTLARNGQVSVSLPANSGTLATGSHTITAFTLNPVTASGTGDQFLANDTLTRSFSMLGSLPAPLIETFESPIFPPANWGVINPNGDLTWQRSTVGNGNAGSAYISNWNNVGRGQLDYLVSPNVTYTGVDSISLSFDISAVTKLYPGSQQLPLDTVEVFVTTNCGASFTSVYKKWGADLQTVGNPNDPQPFEFFPVGPSHWRNEKIDLTAFAPTGPLQVVFRNRNGFGNNVFIDNVNLKTRTLPASLKADGLQILPSPFQSTFQIWHLQQPTTLKSVRIFNSAGQLVWQKEYSLTAPKIIDVDLSRYAAGMYVVELRYSTRGTDQQIRVIKTQ